MKSASGEFADDPCSSVKRGNMVRAARALLSAVTRLLILADMADVYKLLVQLKVVSVVLCCDLLSRLPGMPGVLCQAALFKARVLTPVCAVSGSLLEQGGF